MPKPLRETRRGAEALARWLAERPNVTRHGTGEWYALADDSGLEVDALQGALEFTPRVAALDTLSGHFVGSG